MKKISANIISNEAKKMWLKVEIISETDDLFYVEDKYKKILFKNIDCGLNSSLGIKLAWQKKLTYVILDKNWIRIPKSIILKDKKYNLLDLQFPLVVKPWSWEHWDWVSVNIKNTKELESAILKSNKYDKETILQEFLEWDDYRLLVIDYKFIAAMKRIPAHVIWNGKSSIKELIKIENKKDSRWVEHEKSLSKIVIDKNLKENLNKCNLNIDYKPKDKEKIFLRKNANLSTWGISVDVTEIVNPEIKIMAEKSAKLLGLKVCWIDYISTDIKKPLKKQNGGIIEINCTPWLRWHHFPAIGKPRNIAKKILELAFKELW